MTNSDWNDNSDYHYEPEHGSSGADWLISGVRRNPEAFLVLAAGVALLLRGGRSYWRRSSLQDYRGPTMDVYGDDEGESDRGRRRGRLGSMRETLSGAAETAGEYASGVYEAAGTYASSAASYAEEGGRRLSRQASRFGRQASRFGSQTSSAAGQMLHEQPLAVAALGLASGAAVAALLPHTDVEGRAFRPARNALSDAASRAADTVRAAAGEAGRRLQEGAAERGLSPEGIKDLARDAAQAFTGSIKGESGETDGGSEESSTPGSVPGAAGGSPLGSPGTGGLP